MDSLRRDDVERARATPEGEKLSQGLEMMAAGIRLKRAALATRHPTRRQKSSTDCSGNGSRTVTKLSGPERALQRILEARSYHRGQDLRAKLADLLATTK